VRKELNFGNEVTEIPSAQFLLPKSMKCSKEKCSRKEKTNCDNQVAKIQGEWGERKKDCRKWEKKKIVVAEIVEDLIEISATSGGFNRNFGNEVAEISIKLLQSCLSLTLQ